MLVKVAICGGGSSSVEVVTALFADMSPSLLAEYSSLIGFECDQKAGSRNGKTVGKQNRSAQLVKTVQSIGLECRKISLAGELDSNLD